MAFPTPKIGFVAVECMHFATLFLQVVVLRQAGRAFQMFLISITKHKFHMKNYAFLMVLLTFFFWSNVISAQHGEGRYVPDPDPLAHKKLEQWQDLKFGLLMHWGAYSQWGIVESWSICSEDEGWTQRKNSDDYCAYKKEYENLKTTFNPVDFDPERWARAARDAGMKYMIFTTKHHDGFTMFDSRLTDYKITDTGCPFHVNPKSDVTKALFEAFRNEDMWVGPYFSKPDWHSEYYWWPYFATPDRHVNYSIEKYPDRWEKFIEFTHGQIMELMTGYGPLDILWLDGGWVQPMTDEEILRIKASPDYKFTRLQNQDIRMDELVEKARAEQPGLIVVDRAVHGKNQNYLTPENRVPGAALPYPWESCIIAGGGWSWVPEAKYMSGRQAVHMLVDIVAKGGNLLLNIAPGPRGQWHDEAYTLLEEIGDWIEVNGEAIYGTRAIAPYKEGNICLTANADGSVNAIYLAGAEQDQMPPYLTMNGVSPAQGATITMVGTNTRLDWKPSGSGFVATIPKALQRKPPCHYAWTFRISEIEQ
jgi:alpha-L-fucosidase